MPDENDKNGYNRINVYRRGAFHSLLARTTKPPVVKLHRRFFFFGGYWTFTTESGYDYLGRVQWLTYPDGEKLIYVYDQGGLIKGAYGERQTDHYDYVKQISYDEFGQRVYIKYGNDIETRYTYDPCRRWLENINTGNSLGGTLQNMHYTFDKFGNVLRLDNKAQHIAQSFQYDDLYQLVRAEGTSPVKNKNKNKANHYIQNFSYDTIGNMTRKTSFNQISPGNHMPKELNFDFTYLYTGTKPHAPSQIENWEYQYDANGNTVVKSRLTGAPTGGFPCGGTSGEYFWDEENRLSIAKVNGMSTDYLYDAGGTCTVKRGPGGETLYVSQFYQLQNRQRVTKHFFVGTTRVVSKLSHYNNPNGLYDSGYERKNIYTYHPDHLGSANYITDPRGKQFEHLEYTPYGETWIDDGTNLNIIDYRFTSKELDKHTGLYYFGARYLDPQSSRWLSPDPAEQGINWYTYCSNNPLRYVDPDGQLDVDTTFSKRGPEKPPEASLSTDAAKSLKTNLSADSFRADLSLPTGTMGTGSSKGNGKVDDPSISGELGKASIAPDAITSYVSGAAEKALTTQADNMYHSPVSNSSSRVEAYRKLFAVTDEVDRFKGLAGKAKALGTWGGAGISVVSGAFDVHEDLNNPNLTAEDKRKAVTIDVVKTGASVTAGWRIAGSTLPIITGIVFSVFASAGISYGALEAKKRWIDKQ
jgi:RHS repeat-associated protein